MAITKALPVLSVLLLANGVSAQVDIETRSTSFEWDATSLAASRTTQISEDISVQIPEP